MDHVTDCYYVINRGIGPIFRYGFGPSLFERNTVLGRPLSMTGAIGYFPIIKVMRFGVCIGQVDDPKQTGGHQ